MTITEMKWNVFQAKALVCSLLILLHQHAATGMSGWAGCLDGQDVFATIRENSPSGEFVAELMVETMEGVSWSLDGLDADWLFLDERSIRLNTSANKVLDREVKGPVLMASLLCYEDDALQSVYRILVEILNENDNTPVFAEETILSLFLSELTLVNTVVFTVKATDADNDKLIYSIDQTSPDAEYFKIDLPNSGEVILAKPLDYETKNMLAITIHASEMSTVEHFNTSTYLTITILDGDDQYPQFLPCIHLFQDESSHICTSPVYTVNVTEGKEDIVLEFSPGPILAVDGDRGLDSPVSYAILSGNDEGHFRLDGETGEMRVIRAVKDRLTTTTLHLKVMAYQKDDPRKYSVATVLVHVLAVNQFPPEFDMTEYCGFVTAGKSLASLVNTYGNKALMLHVQDRDFNHGFNPMIRFSFSPTSNHTDVYQITQQGLLVTKTDQLKAKQKHVLEVMAVDQESGDATRATVLVEVLPEGQPIPHSPPRDERVTGCTLGKAFALSMVLVTALGCVLSAMMWLKRKYKGMRDPLERGCVAQGKHPNVSLRWFQLLSHRSAMPHMEDMANNNEEYGTYNPSFSFPDKPATYSHRDAPVPPRAPPAPITPAAPAAPTAPAAVVIPTNNISKSSCDSPLSHPATANENLVHTTQDVALQVENLGSPTDTSPDSPEPPPNTSPPPPDTRTTPPVNFRDSPTTQMAPAPVPSPSSPSSIPCSHSRIASEEIDKPFFEPCVNTPPHSPSGPSSLVQQMATPSPTPEQAPLTAMLVRIDFSPGDTPLETPELESMALSDQEAEICTSLDEMDESEHSDGGAGAQERKPSTNSENTKDGGEMGMAVMVPVDDGFLGDEDAHKNSEEEGEDELDPEDEELLRVLARCNPIFLTFSK